MKLSFKTLKIGYMNSKQIITGIYTVGIIYFFSKAINKIIEIFLFINSGVPSESNFGRIGGFIYWAMVCIDPILFIIFFKFLCEVFYKILKIIDSKIKD